jgi:hypothetical protein
MARTSREATKFRFRSAEGSCTAKVKPGFDSESPVSTDLFAYICAYLRAFALKIFFFPLRDVPGCHKCKQVNRSDPHKHRQQTCAKRHNFLSV